jgi:CheY-like chemotaxis protein
MKLLIVEDNRQMGNLLKSLLSNIAERIFECTDGSEALECYRRHRPDCVLMDIKMESIDGIDATRQIIEVFPTARVIMVTDYDDTELREAAREAGACDYVVKENLLNLCRIVTEWTHPSRLTTG